MAYVGFIAGAIPIEDYRRVLIEAGFAPVEVIDGGADLHSYAKIENQAACCSPPSPSSPLTVVDSGYCTPGPAAVADEALHARLADLLRLYDVNDYDASVKVFAVKPRPAMGRMIRHPDGRVEIEPWPWDNAGS
jgi:hypothetical protein